MMHDREKSDPLIVATKPTNNDGQPLAEPVERRGGAEGNAHQPSTPRTPSREGVTAGPARIRTAKVDASPLNTRGGSRMREFRTYGSVRGARSNARPYRDPQLFQRRRRHRESSSRFINSSGRPRPKSKSHRPAFSSRPAGWASRIDIRTPPWRSRSHPSWNMSRHGNCSP
jgi:hypothetical protein